jgi:2-C-methyl-D-erythritol 4-phosphate cytidylyltransferase
LLARAVTTFGAHPGIDRLVVVAPPTHLDAAAELAAGQVVCGGATRQASVAAGLAEVDTQFVLVHDVARPFVPISVIDSVLEALRAGADAVVPVVPIHDTVRRVGPKGALAGIVDRASLVAVQTPQGFRTDVLVEAHTRAAGEATDDAALVEALGHLVIAVPGAEEAFKITTPADLARAAATIPGGIPT